MNRTRVSLVLTICAVGLWAYSIMASKLTIGFWGLFDSYPILYYVSLGFLTLASFVLWTDDEESHDKLLCGQLVLFITILWLMPVIIGGNPVFAVYRYMYSGHTGFILETGHISSSLLWMLNWPSIFIYEAALGQVTGGIDYNNIISLSAFLPQILILPSLYIIFHDTIRKNNQRWLALWLFFLANWTGTLFLLSQGAGFFLLMTTVALLTKLSSSWKSHLTIGYIVSLVVASAGIAITHLLSSIAGILTFGAFWLIRRLKNYGLILVSLIFVVVWAFYGSTQMTEYQLPGFLERAFSFDILENQLFRSVSNTSISRSAINQVRMAYSAFFAFLATVGLTFALLKDRNKAVVLHLSLLGVAVCMLVSALYGSELFMRTYLFALVPIVYFIVKLFNVKSFQLVLLFTILAALPANIISHYGNAAVDFVPPGEGEYSTFMRERSMPGEIIGGYHLFIPGYKYIDIHNTDYEGILGPGNERGKTVTQYIHIGMVDEGRSDFLFNQDTIPVLRQQLNQSTHYDLVYAGANVDVFYRQDVP